MDIKERRLFSPGDVSLFRGAPFMHIWGERKVPALIACSIVAVPLETLVTRTREILFHGNLGSPA